MCKTYLCLNRINYLTLSRGLLIGTFITSHAYFQLLCCAPYPIQICCDQCLIIKFNVRSQCSNTKLCNTTLNQYIPIVFYRMCSYHIFYKKSVSCSITTLDINRSGLSLPVIIRSFPKNGTSGEYIVTLTHPLLNARRMLPFKYERGYSQYTNASESEK